MDCSHWWRTLNCRYCIKVYWNIIHSIGSSMYPTFQDRNKVIVSKISKTLNHIDNGDVVVFHEDAQRDFIKRVIGTPVIKLSMKVINYMLMTKGIRALFRL